MHLFYHPHIQGDTLELEEKESSHAIRVLRLEEGDHVSLVDGRGGWYEAVIIGDHPKRCLLHIESRTEGYRPLSYALHLAVAPTKNLDRFEWFLEKSTEIGISEITPIICKRSERKRLKMDRLEKILISAMKQSLKAYKPRLNQLVSMEKFLLSNREGTLGIAHCYPLEKKGIRELDRTGNYTFIVGPEGDFTEEEVRDATQAGYKPVHLGTSRLRTETAALYITTAISLLHT
jgi:16S rRNA (uracil1498-N3)-methyltransferase